jgi:hypothetical protein
LPPRYPAKSKWYVTTDEMLDRFFCLAVLFLRALHLSTFEQPQTPGSRNIIFDLEME